MLMGAALLGLLALTPEGFSMNHNLAAAWGDSCSPPQSAFVSFSVPSAKDDSLMFKNEKVIRYRIQAGLRCNFLKWSLHRNMVNTPFMTGVLPDQPGALFYLDIPTDKLIPGFYDLRVELDTGVPANKEKDRLLKRPAVGVSTFGWKIEEMKLAENRPADFKAFWDKAKDELKSVDLAPKDETEKKVYDKKGIAEYNTSSACLPPDYDPTGHKFETVESWKISFAGPEKDTRVYAWLAKPEGNGPFPAMLVLPGAGFNARPRPLEHARHGFLTIDMQVHGQDVDLEGKYPQVEGYYKGQVFEPANQYYYYNIHKRILLALEYLAKRPDVDAKRIVVVGGSQGGRLGVVAAGLSDRVAALVACIPHFANAPHRMWVSEMNRTKKDGMNLTGAPPSGDTPEARGTAYFDPMNYAQDIKCPVLFNAGNIDPVSPAYSAWAPFLRIKGDKTMIWLPGLGHDWSSGFDRLAWKWLAEKLKL